LSYGANYLFQNSLFNPETFPIAIGMLYSIELGANFGLGRQK